MGNGASEGAAVGATLDNVTDVVGSSGLLNVIDELLSTEELDAKIKDVCVKMALN